MNKRVTNIAASIRQRLLNRARTDQRPFNELLQYFAMERWLYRLSQSQFSDRYVLKGALMLRVWNAPHSRPTMDIDLLGFTDHEIANIVDQFESVLKTDAEEDGLRFDPTSIRTESIIDEAEYHGVRVRFLAHLDSAKIALQIDIGFEDAVYPQPSYANLPSVLDFPTPRLLCYSRESVIAEKLETMIRRDRLNSRMKDFFDIWMLSRQYDFDGEILQQAIVMTLERRETTVEPDFTALTVSFAEEKQVQWAAFHRRLGQASVPKSFMDIIEQLVLFLTPVVDTIMSGRVFRAEWRGSNREWRSASSNRKA